MSADPRTITSRALEETQGWCRTSALFDSGHSDPALDTRRGPTPGCFVAVDDTSPKTIDPHSTRGNVIVNAVPALEESISNLPLSCAVKLSTSFKPMLGGIHFHYAPHGPVIAMGALSTERML